MDRRAISEVDTRTLRDALGRFPTGVAVVTAAGSDGSAVGVTVNSFAAVSLDPALVLWSLRRDSASLPLFLASGHYIVHLLGEEQAHLCNHFAKPADNKFVGVEHDFGIGGAPALPGCLATFECRIDQTVESGDHIILIGAVETLSYRAGAPLVFAEGRLTALKGQEAMHAAS